jgi:branched-chain amino acid transport system substrate-binding protein
MSSRRDFLKSTAGAAAGLITGAVRTSASDMPGITDTEIKIGQTMAYSGPASAYGVIGKAEAAYFRMINDQGGVGGRKINFISVDDGYSPPKTVEQARRLVEQEKVAFLFQTLGTPSSLTIRQYCNDNRIPQLFVASGANLFNDPKHFPWSLRFNPSYQTEAKIYAKHILANNPNAKIAVLYQNDGLGREYLEGLKQGLGADHAAALVKETTYEVSEPIIDSQVVAAHGSGADVFVIATTPKFATQAIRKSFDLGWTAARYLALVSGSRNSVLKPAGFDKSNGLISANYSKDVTDPDFQDDPGVNEWKVFCNNYMSPNDFAEPYASYGFTVAATMVHVLKKCGADLSRANILKEATTINSLPLPMLLPSITVNTSPDNYAPIRQLRIGRFDGERWVWSSDVISE